VRSISAAIRDERTTTQTDLFQANPPGPGQLADFRVARSLRINSDMFVARALKISQLTDGGMPPTYDSMHKVPLTDLRHRGTLSELVLFRFAAITGAATLALARVFALAAIVPSLAATLSLAVILAFTRVLAFVGV
jgi:hypothetical protein